MWLDPIFGDFNLSLAILTYFARCCSQIQNTVRKKLIIETMDSNSKLEVRGQNPTYVKILENECMRQGYPWDSGIQSFNNNTFYRCWYLCRFDFFACLGESLEKSLGSLNNGNDFDCRIFLVHRCTTQWWCRSWHVGQNWNRYSGIVDQWYHRWWSIHSEENSVN